MRQEGEEARREINLGGTKGDQQKKDVEEKGRTRPFQGRGKKK